MKVGWLCDWSDTPGGAELTQDEFRAAAPEGVEIVDCPPAEWREDGPYEWQAAADWDDCDVYVVQNCVRYTLDDLRRLDDKRVVKYWHDVGPWLKDGVRGWLDENAEAICCSPMQAEYMGLNEADCIPPPVDLSRFEQAAASVNGNRRGSVSVGSWRNHGKAAHKAAEWASQNGIKLDFFGGGLWAPQGSQEVPYEHMPALLASYERFVFLPTVLEPFGRLVAEAWAAGCEVVTNDLVGARWWIENDPQALDSAAERFWKVVMA